MKNSNCQTKVTCTVHNCAHHINTGCGCDMQEIRICHTPDCRDGKSADQSMCADYAERVK